MKKLCLTLAATMLLSLAAMAQSTPIQEQEKMSEPEQSTEVNRSKEDGIGKAADTDQSTAEQPTTNEKDRKTVTQKEKKNKPGKRSQNDEDETGKKPKSKKENPE
jgi:hypothetical protein